MSVGVQHRTASRGAIPLFCVSQIIFLTVGGAIGLGPWPRTPPRSADVLLLENGLYGGVDAFFWC